MTETFEQKWAAIEASPTYKAASPRDRKDMARFFARKVARQEVPGNHARMRSFLEKNVTGTSTRPDTKSAFGEGLREGFGLSAVGMVSRGRLPDEGIGIVDAAKSLLPGGGNSLLGEGALRGALGATGAMVGQAPDIALGMGAGSLAAKGLARAGLKAAPAALAASVGTGAVIPGGAVKIAGGTNEQALGAAALGAAGGTLPFAAPAAKALGIPNPHIAGRRPSLGTVTAKGQARAPRVDMRNSGRPAREVWRAAEPPVPSQAWLQDQLPRVPESHRLPAGPMGPQPYPDWMTQGEFPAGPGLARPMPPGAIEGLPPEGGLVGQRGQRPVTPPAPGTALVPVGPVRTTYGMPPVGQPEGGLVGQVGPRPPAEPVRGMMSPQPPKAPLALPPVGGTGGVIPAGPIQPPRLGRTAEQQVGQRPPSALRDPARMDDKVLLLEMQKWEREAEAGGARAADEGWVVYGNQLEEELGRRGFERVDGYGWGSERHYERPDFSKMSDEEVVARADELRKALARIRAAVTRGEAQEARKGELSQHELSKKIGISGTFLEQNTNTKMLLERELQDLLSELGHRKRIAKAADPKGQAPAKGAVRRLIEDERGEFDINATMKGIEDALDWMHRDKSPKISASGKRQSSELDDVLTRMFPALNRVDRDFEAAAAGDKKAFGRLMDEASRQYNDADEMRARLSADEDNGIYVPEEEWEAYRALGRAADDFYDRVTAAWEKANGRPFDESAQVAWNSGAVRETLNEKWAARETPEYKNEQAVLDMFRRLAADEDGTFDPKAAYEGASKAVEAVRNLWRGSKSLAVKGARLGAPASNLANVERNILLPGGKALYDTAERVGLNDATRAAGRLVDTALTVPLATGPAPLRAAVNFGRRLTQSRYDVPEDVFEQKVRIAPARARANFKETEELAVDLGKRLTSGEQFDLHKQVAEPTYTGAMSPDAKRVQADNQRVSDYLLQKGVITPEEHARWGQYYLPREYAIHDADGKMAAAGFKARRAFGKIVGTHGRGTFENVGGKKAWRDYTIPEREKWGERRNVTRALALKKAKGEQNAAAAEYLDWVSKQGQYTLDPAVTNPGVAKADLPDTITGPDGKTYHLVPEGWAMPGGKRRRVHRYGNLAGKYVREDVYRFTWDQVLLDDLVAAGNLVTQNQAFKRLKTVWNAPNYFINNAFHNFPMLIANGGAVSDLPAAIAKLADGDPLVAKLEADGFIKNDAMSRELALQVTKILAEQNASASKIGPLQMSRILSDAYHNLKALENEGHNVAQNTDDAFRVALVDRLMQDGVPYEQAAKRMNDVFYNPERVTAPAARVLGATAVPFAKVNWYVANALKETAANNPTRAAEMVMMYLAAPYVVGTLLGKSMQEVDAEREALPPHMKGVGNAMPVPIPGAGVPTWLGTVAANPTQNFMATGETVIPGVPRGFQPGGFAFAAAPLFQRNGVDAFTGKPINEYDQEGNVIRSGTKDYVLRNFAPGFISNTSRFADAMQGKVTPRGDVIPRPVAAARMLGLQVQPVDLERAKDISAGLTRRDVEKYKAEARRQMRHAKALRENGQEAEADAAIDEGMRFLEMARQAGRAGKAKREKMEIAP